MASLDRSAILIVIERLALAYPGKVPPAQSLQVYVESLSDIPPWVLRRAADAIIRRSSWFPRIADLRSAAAELCGTSEFHAVPPFPVDYLTYSAVKLEEAFYRDGALDEAEWQSLIAQLEKAARAHRAQRLREKLAAFTDPSPESSFPLLQEELQG
jgi:hypothetical protein